jgi:hypothetical protein
MLESGRYATVRDFAKAEAINESYLGRVLSLTLLSPTLIDAILEGDSRPTSSSATSSSKSQSNGTDNSEA